MTETALPSTLAEIAEDFRSASNDLKLQLLLEFSDELPGLPERYAGRLDELERVDECQSPLFLTVEVDDGTSLAERPVHLFFDAPAESPTTRGFAGILHEGLDGLTAAEVLGIPDDAPMRFGLAEAVSPLRMRGMVAMLARIKRQVREKSAA
jgi:cysteine desulfuration protein SufE